MSLTSLNAADANRLVLEAFGSGWESYESQGQKIFHRRDPERKDEIYSVHATDATINTVAEGATFPAVNVEQVGTKTLSQAVYKKEIPVTQLMKRFDNYGVVVEEAMKLGYYAKWTMDDVMASILRNVEGTSTTWDGLSLGNASHLVGNTGTTQSNIVTGSLSKSTLNSAYTALQDQVDHGGAQQPLATKQVVVPPALAMTAFELLGSPSDPETADRSINFINALGMELVVWPLISNNAGGSDVDYHIVADKMFHRLQYLVSLEPRVNYVRDQNTGNDLYQIDFACVAGAPDYLGYVFGNQA